ncbi:DUF6192 family protein [Streptomyces sp. SudanB66_2053]|uniref:DUF6192 family protein n=1 Tax=Streptomyces sp. SudanB66_2053 TaxID=3035277 RepID=UPI003F5442C0
MTGYDEVAGPDPGEGGGHHGRRVQRTGNVTRLGYEQFVTQVKELIAQIARSQFALGEMVWEIEPMRSVGGLMPNGTDDLFTVTESLQMFAGDIGVEGRTVGDWRYTANGGLRNAARRCGATPPGCSSTAPSSTTRRRRVRIRERTPAVRAIEHTIEYLDLVGSCHGFVAWSPASSRNSAKGEGSAWCQQRTVRHARSTLLVVRFVDRGSVTCWLWQRMAPLLPPRPCQRCRLPGGCHKVSVLHRARATVTYL